MGLKLTRAKRMPVIGCPVGNLREGIVDAVHEYQV
jgi:hypothetical protein